MSKAEKAEEARGAPAAAPAAEEATQEGRERAKGGDAKASVVSLSVERAEVLALAPGCVAST